MDVATDPSMLYQLRFPKNAQVLRDRRLGHIEDVDEAVNVELTVVALGELFNHANSTLVTQSAEDFRELSCDDNSCWHLFVLKLRIIES